MYRNILIVVGITILFLGMSNNPFMAVDIVNIEHISGKSSCDDVDWWPMFRHDLQHSGFSTSDAPVTNNVLWKYKIGNRVQSSPAVADGRVYIGCDDSRVYCLDANTGGFIWSYTTGRVVSSSPAVADGKVYIGSGDHKGYCLDANTGKFIWSYKTGNDVESSPAIADGRVYIGSRDDNVYCLDANTGDYIWNYTTRDQVNSAPAVVNDKVYFGSDSVYCLDADTGNFIWSYTTGDQVRSSPAVVNGKVYIGSRDDNVYCLDANTGGYIWSYTTGGSVSSSPAVADGKVYIGSDDYRMYCLDANTGDYIWSYKTGHDVESSPAVADGIIYIGGSYINYGFVYAFGSNSPPDKPTITGPPSGEVGVEYEYTFHASDPDGDDVKYFIVWGDLTSEWTDFYPSGTDVKVKHMWYIKGNFKIKAEAEDIYYDIGPVGTLKVTMPKNKCLANSLVLRFLDRFPLLEVFLRAMNKLLSYLDHKDWKLKLPPVERRLYDTLTEEERERYLDTVNKRCEGILDKSYSQLKPKEIKYIMDRAIVMIQTTMESRPSEICDIEIRNIDFERHKIKLRDCKTHEMIIRMGMEDALLMTPAVEESIKDWLKIRKKIDADDPEDDKYLFIYPYGKYKGEKINYNKLLKVCKEIGIEAKIKTIKTTPYCLKRTEITRDCDRTNNIRIPQLRARHTDFNSTMRYNQKTTNDVVDYLQSEKYDDTYLTPETKLKKLAERAVKGEIPLEVWQQLRADLQIDHPENKKKPDLVGYG